MSPRPEAPGGADPFENDDSIPLLTDVVAPGSGEAQVEAQAAAAIAALTPPALSPPVPAPVAPPPAAAEPAAAPPAAAPEAAAPVSPGHDAREATRQPEPAPARDPEPHEWAELAARIEHGVTSRMLEQAGPMLEASLQSMVSPLIEQAAVQIAQDLHDAFSHLVRDLVARALAEELALLQTRDAQSAPDEPPADARDAAPPAGAPGHSAFFRASPP